MNKLFSKIAALSVGLAMAVGVGVAVSHESVREARAEEHTVTWTATSGALGTGIGSGSITDTGGFSWTYTRTLISGASYTGWTSDCIQLGKNGGVENLTLTTSNIPGTIKSVGIECASYSNAHKVSITVGSSTYLASTATPKWTTVDTKSGTGESSGAITISFTDGSRALYIKSLTVTYDDGEAPTGPFTVTYNGNGATSGSMSDPTEYESGATVTIRACEYMRTDYEVTGWNTKADGSGTSYVLSGQFEITSNVTLYAQWKYVGKGSENNPYTVAEAIEAVDASTFPTPAYVTGIICQVDAYKPSYHSIDYWISDDGETTTKLESYSGKGIDGADFNAKEDIEVGATVVLCGTLKVYKGTYELDINNYQVSYTAPVHSDPTLLLSSAKAHLTDGGESASTTITASYESFSGTPTVSVVGTPEKVNVAIEGDSITISGKAVGVETITFRATYNSEVADKEFKVVVTTNRGTAENPFLVSEARNVIDVLESFVGYVYGTVSQVDSYDSTYHSVTYWISDDGTTTDQLQCYSGKGYNGANFSSKDDLSVDTVVIVSGTLKMHNSTYEFDKNNRIAEFPRVENLALEIMNRTYPVCKDYDGVTDNHDAIADIWELLSGEGYYGDFTATEKTFIQSIEGNEEGGLLEQAMARYDYLTGKYELDNFIEGRTPKTFSYVNVQVGENNNSSIIIIVIASISVLSFGLALALRKKRTK